MPNRRSSIYESTQGSGKWHGWVWLGIMEDGKPDRRHRRGASRAEVTAAVRKLERARDVGKAGRAGLSKLTVLAWGQQRLHIVADRGQADSTVARYRTDLEMYINPRVGAVRLSALTGDDIERILAQMRTDGLSAASRGTCYRTIRAMLRESQKRGRLTSDPLATCCHLRPPTVPARQPSDPPTMNGPSPAMCAFTRGSVPPARYPPNPTEARRASQRAHVGACDRIVRRPWHNLHRQLLGRSRPSRTACGHRRRR